MLPCDWWNNVPSPIIPSTPAAFLPGPSLWPFGVFRREAHLQCNGKCQVANELHQKKTVDAVVQHKFTKYGKSRIMAARNDLKKRGRLINSSVPSRPELE
jgi:hypothetical protein